MRLYVAGPAATVGQHERNAQLAAYLRGEGHAVWLPQENPVGSTVAIGDYVQHCRDGLRWAEVVLAGADEVLTPFTAWELGHAAGERKPVIGWRVVTAAELVAPDVMTQTALWTLFFSPTTTGTCIGRELRRTLEEWHGR